MSSVVNIINYVSVSTYEIRECFPDREIQRRSKFIIEPGNPYNDLAEGLGATVIKKFVKFSQETLRRLGKACPEISRDGDLAGWRSRGILSLTLQVCKIKPKIKNKNKNNLYNAVLHIRPPRGSDEISVLKLPTVPKRLVTIRIDIGDNNGIGIRDNNGIIIGDNRCYHRR
jgi:hypothetical protein